MGDSNTPATPVYTHLISDERWGETCLIEDMDAFVRDMEESMFPASVAAQTLSERQQIAAERGEECEDTLESLVDGWRDELRDACQDVEPVTLADGRTAYMTSREAVYVETANGLASYEGEWSDLRQTELSTVLRQILGDSIIHTDRGNGCAGAGYEDATDVVNEIDREDRDDEDLTLVLESEDAEAWDLARDAFRDVHLDPSTIRAVAVGERADGDNGHQVIYCW